VTDREAFYPRYLVLDRFAWYNARRAGRVLGRVAHAGKLLLATLAGIAISLVPRREAPDAGACEVLVIHGWGGGERYVGALSRALAARGVRVRHVLRAARLERVRRWLFLPAAHRVPLRWRLDAWYAAYLVRAHRPSVVVTFDNESVFVAMLRMACAGRARTVNISHGVTPLGDNASMFDVDYYLVLGGSSLDHCRRRRLRIGSTRVVEAGFMTIGEGHPLAPSTDRRTLLFLSQLSAVMLASRVATSEMKDLLFRNTGIVMAFAREHPEYMVLVRRHPLEVPGLIEGMAAGLANVTVLPDSMGMREAVERASGAIVMYSNAALEVAALGRPLVVVNDTEAPDAYLETERFFQPRARTAAELFGRVRTLYEQYDAQLRGCEAFVGYHLARVRDAVPFQADLLAALVRGGPEPAGEDLPERLDGLTEVA